MQTVGPVGGPSLDREATIELMSDQVSTLIGTDVLKQLETETACKIAIARSEADPHKREVKIRGPPEDVEAARKKINSLFQKDPEVVRPLSSALTITEEQVAVIVGRGCEKLAEIEKRTGAKIALTRPAADRFREITLQGPDAAVEQAYYEIEQILHAEENEVETFVVADTDLPVAMQQAAERRYGVRLLVAGRGVIRIRGLEASVVECARVLSHCAVRRKVSLLAEKYFHARGENLSRLRDRSRTRSPHAVRG